MQRTEARKSSAAGKARLSSFVAVPALLVCTALSHHAAQAQPTGSTAIARAEISALPNGLEARSGSILLSVTALTDEILRVRIGRDSRIPEDASWAVPAQVRSRSIRVTPTPDGFSTATLRVRIDPATFALTVEDRQGRVVSADADRPLEFDGSAFTLRKQLPLTEQIYGLGDKTGSLSRREQSFVNWNTDAFAFTSSTDPIYKSVPFYIGTGGAGGSYGILLDNSWRTWFDFGHREADVTAIGGPDGPIDYYLIAGPSTAEVVRRYTDLTGRPPLPPKWAFGYQQSRYSYMTEAEVREIAARLRAEDIPTDVIWLDIDFQDRNRPFTVNKETFPDLPGLAADMKKQGIELVAITDLHIARAEDGYEPYRSGSAGNHFVHNPDGSVFVGPVWPGPSVFPDFSREASRDWWGSLYKDFLDIGIGGFWNDMNEPSVFETLTKTMPIDTVHRIESDDFSPRHASHAEIHNVYGLLNARATYEGLLKLRPDERPFVMTRASYAGGQRYGVTWTGDNGSTWDHLKLSIQQTINLGLSGFAYTAADIGGFTGGPSPELLTRWYQIGAFTPVFREHAMKGTPRVEPWLDGPEHLEIRRRFIQERYRLLPYFYALADQNFRTGDPILRPVFYDYPDVTRAHCDQSMSFTLGRALLVAASPKPESPQTYDVCLPAGGWYDYWTGLPVGKAAAVPAEQAIAGASQTIAVETFTGDVVQETPALERLPVFVRAGTILPRQPLVRSTAEVPQGPLSLHVYPGRDCKGTLYADDGRSLGYQRGSYLRQSIRCSVTAEGVTIDFGRSEGSFAPWWKQIAVTVHGRGGGSVTYQGRRLPVQADPSAQTISFMLTDSVRNGGTVEITNAADGAASSSSRGGK